MRRDSARYNARRQESRSTNAHAAHRADERQSAFPRRSSRRAVVPAVQSEKPIKTASRKFRQLFLASAGRDGIRVGLSTPVQRRPSLLPYENPAFHVFIANLLFDHPHQPATPWQGATSRPGSSRYTVPRYPAIVCRYRCLTANAAWQCQRRHR